MLARALYTVLLFTSTFSLMLSAAIPERTILCFGDSITAAGDWQRLLEEQTPHRYLNAGRSGRKAQQAPAELAAALADSPEADSLLLMLGVNDLPARDPRPGEVKVAACIEGMESALRTAMERFAPWNIVLVAPPTVHPDRLSDINLEKGYQVTPPLLEMLDEGYRRLAHTLGTGFVSMRERIPADSYRDGLHPNLEGHAALAEALAGSMRAWRQPQVFLVGDSISMNYHEALQQLAQGHYGYSRKGGLAEAEANLDVATGANGGDSTRVLNYLTEVMAKDLVDAPYIVVNCGLHDIKTDPHSAAKQVPLAQYRSNLEQLVERVRLSGRQLIWISTTPVDEQQHRRHTSSFYRYEADLAAYNDAAAEVMSAADIPIIDLYAFTEEIRAAGGNPFRDHVHFTPQVSERQAAYVHEQLMAYLSANYKVPSALPPGEPVKGWNILSRSIEDGLRVVQRAADFSINHLQLSHQIVHNLHELQNAERAKAAATLTRAAHLAGIREVVLWDHMFYGLDYYPQRFRTGPGGVLNLDDPAFWEWLKDDYRRMLDAAPPVQGIVLTFIETKSRVEDQYSATLLSDEAKLGAAVNAIADVVIGERGMNLYARTFAYDASEYERISKAVAQFSRPQIRLMMKEAPHDFFLTHPNNQLAGRFERPSIVEFDTAGEFNGQGLIANTWPQYILRRASDLLNRNHVVGYVARTDRYGHTRILDQPSEVNLHALRRFMEDRNVDPQSVSRDFIRNRYGAAAVEPLQRAFAAAYTIVNCSLYTLGTNMARHSAMDFDPYSSSYARHVSGKWIQPPVVSIGHGVDRQFHYWKDIIEHLAPAWAKAGGAHLGEVPQVVENGWLTPGESMNERYLRLVLTEKAHGVALARSALSEVDSARAVLAAEDYQQLQHYFARTLLTARLYEATAAAYWGFRVWARGSEHRSTYVIKTTRDGLLQMIEVASAIESYPVAPASGGQWGWTEDAAMARRYWHWIVEEGWPEKHPSGRPYAMAGLKFPLSGK